MYVYLSASFFCVDSVKTSKLFNKCLPIL
uniref:Uncharacterized protein n=1 Tax=Anguilla anguilla TaxID=7936 RepID=A0A0E9SH96_ANGAN